jgi:AhpD family alkylhydroperoxidase
LKNGLFAVVVGAVVSATAFAAAPNPEVMQARSEMEKLIGFVPDYMKQVPDVALPGAWEEMRNLQISDKTALPCKIKELIGVAVAAQIPCRTCAYGHAKIAKAGGGATDQEVGEAVALASLTRHWSTFFNGMQLDETKFRADFKQIVENAKKGMASGMPPPPPVALTDAKSVYKDMEQSFGLVPEFARKFPEASLPGAWRELRDVELSPNTALSGKYKSLIGIAVAAQIPCKYCLVSDTEFAKLEGATDAEIAEAVAMGGLVRHWATLLEGTQFDEAAYKRDYDKIAKGLAKMKGSTASAK